MFHLEIDENLLESFPQFQRFLEARLDNLLEQVSQPNIRHQFAVSSILLKTLFFLVFARHLGPSSQEQAQENLSINLEIACKVLSRPRHQFPQGLLLDLMIVGATLITFDFASRRF